jgi:hypothetical protein
MYSALVKLTRAFLHSVAMLICFVLMITIAASTLQTPVEICAAYGIHWAHRVLVWFVG